VVYVESESRKVGDLRTPETLLQRMWSSDCVVVEASLPVRVERLLADYHYLTTDLTTLFDRLDCLIAVHGRERIAQWKLLAENAQWRTFVEVMLIEHYDVSYRKSINHHYPNISAARRLQLANANPSAIDSLTSQLL